VVKQSQGFFLVTIEKPERIAVYAIISALSVSILAAGNFLLAEAVLIEPAEHWKYNVTTWIWDSDLRRNMGVIKPQIVIENETAGRLDGYIADQSGTRLAFYSGEQVVMVSYAFDNGAITDWERAGSIHGGNFTINISDSNKEADAARIFIGNNQYTVNDGTRTTPQTWVFTNSARMDYELDPAIQQGTAAAVAEEPVVRNAYSPDSLIDRILMMYQLPIRSADAGK
jgi:hypothetical protein